MSHSESNFEIKHKPLPNENFLGWLKSSTSLLASQIAIVLSLLLYLGHFGYYVIGNHGKGVRDTYISQFDQYGNIIFVLNIVVLIIFIFYSRKLLEEPANGKFQTKEAYKLVFGERFEKEDKTQQQTKISHPSIKINQKGFEEVFEQKLQQGEVRMKKFLTYIRQYWFFALVYYLITVAIKAGHIELTNYYKVMFHALDCIQFVMILRCYVVMVEINPVSKLNSLSGWIFKKYFPLFSWIVLFLPILVIFIPAVNVNSYTIITALVGLSNSVIIALLVSRLDSKFIGLPSYLVMLLYGYALIQPVFNILSDALIEGMVIKTTIYFCVLVFKIYFFLIILYAYNSGRLLCYFTNATELTLRLKKLRYCKPDFAKDNMFPSQNSMGKYQRSIAFLFRIAVVSIFIFVFFQIFGSFHSVYNDYLINNYEKTKKVLLTVNLLIVLAFSGVLFFKSRGKRGHLKPLSRSTNEHADDIYNKVYVKAPLNFPAATNDHNKTAAAINKFTRLLMMFSLILAFYYGFCLFEQEARPYNMQFQASIVQNDTVGDHFPYLNSNDTIQKYFEMASNSNRANKDTSFNLFNNDNTENYIINVSFGKSNSPDTIITIEKYKILITDSIKKDWHFFITDNFLNDLFPVKKDIAVKHEENKNAQKRNHYYGWTGITSFMKVNLNNWSIYFLYCCFVIMYSYSRRKTDAVLKNMIYRNKIVIVMLAFSQFVLMIYSFSVYKENSQLLENQLLLFSIIGGVLNAFGMAMLIGRLDSKFIGLHHYVVALLLAYASLQPLFLIFFYQAANYLSLELIILFMALVLKVFLFVVLYNVIFHGGLLTYLRCFKELDKRMDTIFSNQFEFIVYTENHNHEEKMEVKNENIGKKKSIDNTIHSAKLTYQIKYKGSLVFISYKYFNNRDEISDHIEKLRESIKLDDGLFTFEIKEKFGAYIIELANKLTVKEYIGYFKDFTVKEKCSEFMSELKQMLPYCKVHFNLLS